MRVGLWATGGESCGRTLHGGITAVLRTTGCRARVGQRGRRSMERSGRGGGSGGWRVSAAAARRRARGRGAQGLPPTYGYLRPTQPPPPPPHPYAPLQSYVNIHYYHSQGGQAPARNVTYSAVVLATRAGAPSPGGSQPTGHDWTCSTGTGAPQHHSRHLPHTHRGGHVGSSQHKRIEHEQLPAAARAWSPIHTEPDFSVTALTPRARVCGHRHHSAVEAESPKTEKTNL